MNIHHVLFFCFISALCGGKTGLIKAKTLIHPEGSSLTVSCPFSIFGRKKFLCKHECDKDGDILIETQGDRAQRGRYSIIYQQGTFPVSSTVLHVSIAQLTKSDSGWYTCGLERPFLPDSYWKFEIRVTDAPLTFPETMKQQELQQPEKSTAAAVYSMKVSRSGYILTLVACVTVVLLIAVVFLLYKLKTSLNTRGQSRDRNMELTTFKRRSDCEVFIPDKHPPVTRNNQDRIYCNL